MTYNWDLMLRLLREAQKSGNETFTPRQYADEHAIAMEDAGQPMPNMDSLKADAQNYESLLFDGGFMVARPEEQGGNGENFILTERGTQLLHMLEGGDGATAYRQRLDEQGAAALTPEVFDGLTAG
ncbi:MAG TPA: transcriptional regulator [Pseudomonas sp.]|nr:transcriptional regulator [Pseudomonas sp.]